MKTIPEIIDLAISSPDNLPAAMMHCKVLADGLGHEPFKTWITQEVSGYDDPRETPEYRRIRGKLGGQYERYLVDVTYDHVPPQLLGPQLHTLVETVTLPQPVGTIATFPDNGTIGFPAGMEQELLSLINSQFGVRGRFLSLWVTCPTGSFRPVLVTIQHKLVSILSEMNQLFPTDAKLASPTPEGIAGLDRSFDRHINVGRANNVIIAPDYVHVDQSSKVFQQIVAGNWPQMDEFLDKQNVLAEKRGAVKEILDKVKRGDQSEETQRELREWVGEAAEDMASGVGDVLKVATKKAATETLVEGLKKYAPEIGKWGWVLALSFL